MSQQMNFRKSTSGTNSQKTIIWMVGVWQRSLSQSHSKFPRNLCCCRAKITVAHLPLTPLKGSGIFVVSTDTDTRPFGNETMFVLPQASACIALQNFL